MSWLLAKCIVLAYTAEVVWGWGLRQDITTLVTAVGATPREGGESR